MRELLCLLLLVGAGCRRSDEQREVPTSAGVPMQVERKPTPDKPPPAPRPILQATASPLIARASLPKEVYKLGEHPLLTCSVENPTERVLQVADSGVGPSARRTLVVLTDETGSEIARTARGQSERSDFFDREAPPGLFPLDLLAHGTHVACQSDLTELFELKPGGEYVAQFWWKWAPYYERAASGMLRSNSVHFRMRP